MASEVWYVARGSIPSVFTCSMFVDDGFPGRSGVDGVLEAVCILSGMAGERIATLLLVACVWLLLWASMSPKFGDLAREKKRSCLAFRGKRESKAGQYST